MSLRISRRFEGMHSAHLQGSKSALYWTACHEDERTINLPNVWKHRHSATPGHTPDNNAVTKPHLAQVGFSTSRATVSYTNVPPISYFRVPYLLYILKAPSALNGKWQDAASHQDANGGRGINCKADLTLQ